MSKEIQITQKDTKISGAIPGFSPEQVAIIKNTVAKGVTDTELAYFLMLAQSVHLNPFKKEIWCYKDNKGNVIIFAGRDGFLTAAQKTPAFNGLRSAFVCEKDDFKLDIPNNKIEHSFGAGQRGKIIGAYAIAFRKDGEPTIEWADFATFNKGYNAWKSHPGEMIQKVAESKALKKAFGLSGFEMEETYDFQRGTFAKEGTDEAEGAQILQTSIDEIDKEIEHSILIAETKEQLTTIYNENQELHSNATFMRLLAAKKSELKNLQTA